MIHYYDPHHDDDPYKEDVKTDLTVLIATLVIIALMGLLLSSCRATKVVTVERVRTDTTYITKQQRDSIFLRDSIYLHEWTKADTVYLLQEKYHTKYIEKITHDTIYQSRVDSIPVPYEVIKEVPRKLSVLQKSLITAGILSILSLIIFLFLKFRHLFPWP